MSTKNIELIEKKITPLLAEVLYFDITGDESLSQSAELLSRANIHLKALTTDKKLITDPIKASLKEIESRYAPAETNLKQIIDVLRTKQSTYQTATLKAQKEDEDKIASRIGTGSGKLKLETAIAKIEDLGTITTKITTNSGKLSFRTDKKLKIIDLTKIPREYLVPNESLILTDLKLGKQIPGCEIEEIQVPINRR